jgi:hypothetical protein
MASLTIERIGGIAGFGGLNSRLRSRGEIDTKDLSNEEKQTVEELFSSVKNTESSNTADTFKYKISRMTSEGLESIEADEDKVPLSLIQSVKDEFL